jgi:hypothetical protein
MLALMTAPDGLAMNGFAPRRVSDRGIAAAPMQSAA